MLTNYSQKQCPWPLSTQTDWWGSHPRGGRRDAEKESWLGKGTQNETQDVMTRWFVDDFIQSTAIFFFLNDSYVSDPVPGTEDAFIDKS